VVWTLRGELLRRPLWDFWPRLVPTVLVSCRPTISKCPC